LLSGRDAQHAAALEALREERDELADAYNRSVNAHAETSAELDAQKAGHALTASNDTRHLLERDAAQASLAAAQAEADRLRKLLDALPADMVDLAADRDSWLEQCEQARQWFQEEAARSKRLREALERLRRAARDPMKSWETGNVVGAEYVEEVCDEALTPPSGGTDTKETR
jgi:hypothetical protein